MKSIPANSRPKWKANTYKRPIDPGKPDYWDAIPVWVRITERVRGQDVPSALGQ